MNKIVASAIPLVACLLVGATARAVCMTDPYRVGQDAAAGACNSIAQGYDATPPSWPAACTVEDVIRCKNAMAQYLRDNGACADLITRDVNLQTGSGAPMGTAKALWRKWSTATCDLP